MAELKIGKLDSDVLQRIVINKIRYRRPEVKTRAGIGEDCAVIDYGEYECVVSTDPITADVKNIGRLAIHISCNDVASNGIEPLGITLAVMLPVGTTESDVQTIMTQAGTAAEEVGVEIIGGHTEVTPAVNQPVIVSTAFGRGIAGESASARNMRPGDMILMTKSAGLEGTGIIATEKAEELTGVLTPQELRRAQGMIRDVSVVKDGITAGRIGTSGMHDVTEGGILGAVWEMCHISGLGAEVELEAIHVDPVTEKIAAHYGINPLRLISSGCMLIVAPPSKAYKIVTEYHKIDVNIKSAIIGKICAAEHGITQIDPQGQESEIAPPYADELYKVMNR
ncbi:MAG: AIR synthase family protein [Hornefia butyriciproducens]|uniref:AIR synthase family protein n=1 Tax=Hornefia butyriciproducens TaxID=2652293 RepID=UPI002A75D946|nr:AIR synthase family protein [Hornefia butyriciproducens]MCI7326888.1 AIR synthase family protein [Clostridiales bacterium]MDY2990774.1 AIR synthase family protein [Hornefia butyriciproducens]